MSISSITLIISVLLNSLIGFLVILKGERNKARSFFMLLTASIVFWCISIFFFRVLADPVLITLWGKIAHIAAAGIGLFVVYFAFYFPYLGKTKKGAMLSVLLPIPFLFLVYTLISTNRIVGEFQKLGDYNYYETGDLYVTYSLFIVFYFAIAFIQLGIKFFQSTNITKTQIGFVFLGTFTSAILGTITNLILPAIKIIKYNWIGPAGTFIMVSFFAYAILKHHLLSIKVITTELFSVILFLLLFVRFLLSGTTGEFVLNGTIAFSFALFGILLIRSVWKEVRLREQLAKTTEDLKSANIELRRLDKAKSEFLSIASHQLRTPLTAIKGYSSMLLGGDYGETSKEVSGIIEKIFLSAKRLAVIVDDFLDISKIESGKMKYDIRKFDLKKAVKNVVDDFVTNNQKARDLSLQFNWEDKNFTTKSDPDKITQVISNVIDNALKYTTKGRVKIYLSKDEEQNKFLIKTEDTGIGISKETLARLFQKFTRAKEISKLHTDGSGLGLYVAKKIMEDLGGRIWAKSPGKNKGSSFFIELPVS